MIYRVHPFINKYMTLKKDYKFHKSLFIELIIYFTYEIFLWSFLYKFTNIFLNKYHSIWIIRNSYACNLWIDCCNLLKTNQMYHMFLCSLLLSMETLNNSECLNKIPNVKGLMYTNQRLKVQSLIFYN